MFATAPGLDVSTCALQSLPPFSSGLSTSSASVSEYRVYGERAWPPSILTSLQVEGRGVSHPGGRMDVACPSLTSQTTTIPSAMDKTANKAIPVRWFREKVASMAYPRFSDSVYNALARTNSTAPAFHGLFVDFSPRRSGTRGGRWTLIRAATVHRLSHSARRRIGRRCRCLIPRSSSARPHAGRALPRPAGSALDARAANRTQLAPSQTRPRPGRRPAHASLRARRRLHRSRIRPTPTGLPKPCGRRLSGGRKPHDQQGGHPCRGGAQRRRGVTV